MSRFFQASMAVAGGTMVGVVTSFLSTQPLKWTLATAAAFGLPVLVALTGSVKAALTAALIVSMSMKILFNPFYSDHYVSPQLGFNITLTSILLVAAYAVGAFNRYWGREERMRLYPSVTIPLLMLTVMAGASSMYAVKPQFVWHPFFQGLENFLFFCYFVNVFHDKDDFRLALRALCAALILASTVGIVQYFRPDMLRFEFMGWAEEPLQLEYVGKTITRPSGFLGHPNNLASFISIFLPIVYLFFVDGSGRAADRLAYTAAFCLGFTALILTYSRGGWIAFGFAASLILLLLTRRHFRKLFPKLANRFVLMAAVGLVIAVPFTPLVFQRLTGDDYGAGESRIQLMRNAVTLIAEKPIIGRGNGFYFDFDPIPPHNIYLQTAVEYGVVGTGLFLWILFQFFRHGVSALGATDPFRLLVAMGVFSGLMGAYLHGMAELGTIAYHKMMPVLFSGSMLVGLSQRVHDTGTEHAA